MLRYRDWPQVKCAAKGPRSHDIKTALLPSVGDFSRYFATGQHLQDKPCKFRLQHSL